jgi:chromosome segregation ATPase
MTAVRVVRRLTVSLALIGTLLVAGLIVRVASSWAAVNAPLSVAPVSIESLEGALAQERARSAALEGQLGDLQGSSASLGLALEAAQTRLGADEATADGLRADLAKAQAKLAKVEAALREAAAARTTTTVVSSGGSRAERGEDREDREEHEDDEHDDD